MNFIIFILSKFGTKLLAPNHFRYERKLNLTLNRNLQNICLTLWH